MSSSGKESMAPTRSGPEDSQQSPVVALTKKIKLTVVSQNGQEVQFCVRMNTPLGRLMHAYAEKIGSQRSELRFLNPNGLRISDSDTAGTKDLEDGDTIEVYLTVDGGCA